MIKLLNEGHGYSNKRGAREVRTDSYQHVVTSYNQVYFFYESENGGINIHGDETGEFDNWLKKYGLT